MIMLWPAARLGMYPANRLKSGWLGGARIAQVGGIGPCRWPRDYFSVIAAAHRGQSSWEDRDDIFVIPPVPHPSSGIITDV